MREEVEKAPTYDDQPCQLTQTAVKISFPEEMRSEIFVNLLGYKEPNLLHLKRSVVEFLSFDINPCYKKNMEVFKHTLGAVHLSFIVKLRERKGQRVDLGRSLKGHL